MMIWHWHSRRRHLSSNSNAQLAQLAQLAHANVRKSVFYKCFANLWKSVCEMISAMSAMFSRDVRANFIRKRRTVCRTCSLGLSVKARPGSGLSVRQCSYLFLCRNVLEMSSEAHHLDHAPHTMHQKSIKITKTCCTAPWTEFVDKRLSSRAPNAGLIVRSHQITD